MAEVTRIRPVGSERVAVDLDGEPWRELSAETAVTVGLAEGAVLSRETLRRLRRAIRAEEARSIAARLLERRDLSARELAGELERRGVRRQQRDTLLAALESASVLDDARLAAARAGRLATAGWGNAAIDHRLVEQGLERDVIAEALAELDAETARASAFLERKGLTGAKAARTLVRRGFCEETVESLFGVPDA